MEHETDYGLIQAAYELMEEAVDLQAGIIDSRTQNYFFDECNSIKELNESLDIVTLIAGNELAAENEGIGGFQQVSYGNGSFGQINSTASLSSNYNTEVSTNNTAS